MKRIRIVLADDHRLFRDGLRRLLEMEKDMEVIGEAEDGDSAVEMVLELNPDVLLFDIHMPRRDGVQVVKDLKKRGDYLPRFVAITAFDDDDHITALSSVGIDAYVLKASGMTELLSAIRSVYRGHSYVDPKVAGKLLSTFNRRKEERDLLGRLTPRELEVLYWIAQGLNNSEIAKRMVLSEKTVKNHVSHILKKLDLVDRTQAAVFAWKRGLAQLSKDDLLLVGTGVD
ncbi:MAG: response regulator transcription factor [Thermanaerothrix sp.]|nr:response regulator transcription factor [Thermanaerothrix sp.]